MHGYMNIKFMSWLRGIREMKDLLSQFIPSKCHRYKVFFFVVMGQYKQIPCFVSNLGKIAIEITFVYEN